jgi:peptidoglycan/LPS O-acetylase OafA/YrhL
VFAATSAGDVAAAWLQVGNWQLLATDHAYADLFAGPSAVLHFWSLAIEEQFYVVVGVAAIVLGRTGRRSARLAPAPAAVARPPQLDPPGCPAGGDRRSRRRLAWGVWVCCDPYRRERG